MKVKVLSTTDGKYVGLEFEVPELSPENVKAVTGKDFDFNNTKFLEENIVELQSSHYTVKLQIKE